MTGSKFLKIYENKGHGGVGLREEMTLETPEIENIVWQVSLRFRNTVFACFNFQTINGIFEEVLEPKVLQKSSLDSKVKFVLID